MNKKAIACIAALLLLFDSVAFAWTCPSCGHEADSRFCGYCGTKQPEQTVVPTGKPVGSIEKAQKITAETVNGVVPDGAYAGQTGLVSVTIPEGTIAIGREAFRGCWNLSEIMFPEGLTVIGEGAFEDCLSLKSITIMPGTVELLDGTFRNCVNLEEVTLPASLMRIGSECFAGCGALKMLSLNGKAAVIGAGAFSGCGALTRLILPGDTEISGESPFDGCVSLRVIAPYDSPAGAYAVQAGFMTPTPSPTPVPTPTPVRTPAPAATVYPSSGGHWEWVERTVKCSECFKGECPVCDGSGWYRLYGVQVQCDTKCKACGGTGKRTERTYEFIPD